MVEDMYGGDIYTEGTYTRGEHIYKGYLYKGIYIWIDIQIDGYTHGRDIYTRGIKDMVKDKNTDKHIYR